MQKPWYRYPLIWSVIIVGTLLAVYEEPDQKKVEGTYVPYPYTNRARKSDSMAQLRALDTHRTKHLHKASNTTILYETEIYLDGKWIKVQQIKIKNFPQPEERDAQEIYDECEGK